MLQTTHIFNPIKAFTIQTNTKTDELALTDEADVSHLLGRANGKLTVKLIIIMSEFV